MDVVRRVADTVVKMRGEHPGPDHWGDGMLVGALAALWEETREKAYLECARQWMGGYIDKGLDTRMPIWMWAGLAHPSLVLYGLTREEQYLRWAADICQTLRDKVPKTPDGGIIPHPPDPYVWVDIVYFSVPGFCRFAPITGDQAYFDAAVQQLLVHRRHLCDEKSGLFFHVANTATGHRYPCLWARGNGWVSLASIEALEHLPPDHAQRGTIRLLLTRQLEGIASLQDPEGLWHTVIDRSDSYLETSCSAMFVYALARSIKRGWVERGFQAQVEKGWAVLQRKVTGDGQVTGVSQQTPPGDLDTYQSIPVGTETFGTGLFLFAGIEVGRLLS